MRAHDWARSPLGEPQDWPKTLRVIVDLTLDSAQPMFLAWGSERTLVYNDAYIPLLGRKHPQALGQPFFSVWHEAMPEVGPLVDRVFQGESLVMDDMSLVLDRNEGAQEAHFAFSYTPVRDDAGRVAGLFCACRDTTDSFLLRQVDQRSNARLREANATLEARIEQHTAQLLVREVLIRTFYEHSSECHAVLKEAGDTFIYEEINPATLRLYEKPREDVIGRSTEEVLGTEAGRNLNNQLRACMERNEPFRYERQQGDAFVEAIATPVPPHPGAARQVVVSARDMTERRHLEQQLLQAQKMEAVGQLTGGLAHDFNNLLTGMMGSLEMSRSRIAQGRFTDIERYLEVAQGAGRRAATLTQRLLAFSRRQTLAPKPTDVNRLVGGMEELIRRTLGPQVEVEFVGAGGLWNTLIDPSQLESALLNLCINARDAMPEGGRLTIETANKWLDERASQERDLSPGQYISLCVTDTGTGMSADIIARAFDPFFTTKPLGEGTGLGLSMVYGFARQSGGQVRIYSEVGKGTTVCLYMPRNRSSAHDLEHVKLAEATPSRGSGEVVLVVDDEPSIRMLIGEVLEEAGYTGIEVADGPTAVKILQSNARIDMLITDVGLPGGMNGRQVADAGRMLRPALKVLFITGYAENAVFGHGYLDASMHLLTKPFPMETLSRRIREILESK